MKIMEALLSPGINSIGVYGGPGVGKTMLVEQIKRTAKEGKLFDVVVMAKVTKNLDLKRIQDEIASDLGLELPNRVTLQGAADLIKSRLTNNKVLVILDDIWEQMDLEKVGIPSGNKQPIEKKKQKISSLDEQTECIVLLTSRDPGVLPPDMPTHRNIKVDQLKEEEAQALFEKIAGKQAESHILRPLAKEIAKKCGGLPIAIATLANTLKSKIPQKWRITLLRLSQEVNLSGMSSSSSLYSAIELRYGDLESKELQQTLWLCSLMGHNAGLQDLLKYGIGLGLFPGAKSMEEGRHEALNLVSKLIRDYSLLLDGGRNVHFDMHDSIREVAISIAAEDHGVLDLRKVAVNDRTENGTQKFSTLLENPDLPCSVRRLLLLWGRIALIFVEDGQPSTCKRFKAILASVVCFLDAFWELDNLDDLIVNLLSLHGLRGKGVFLQVLDALEFCSQRNGSFILLL
ncbi:hypothetical protein SLEP1_g48570 [Rubroshorea leprosula]|uniref:NB-ARC domain-containing protein n=1 Tax=Rubroshorea leprosula TaxID=152421 RepID=A0AAV5LU03_9ROSI|nr:hypothetical protein SLEP1_g48570 [Rubroshorea leprosula]